MKRILAVAAVGGALAVSACGGSKSDQDKIKDVVKKVDDNPAALCDNATKELLAQLGGKAGCQALAKTNKNSGGKSKVTNLKVNGDTATATVTDKTGPSQVTFQKVNGDWKVKSST
jgi:porphobilinogen deaminase